MKNVIHIENCIVHITVRPGEANDGNQLDFSTAPRTEAATPHKDVQTAPEQEAPNNASGDPFDIGNG